jgi:hypothetical protein
MLVAAGCQSRENPQAASVIEVRDPAGAVVAKLTPGHPCRGKLGKVEVEASESHEPTLRVVPQDRGFNVLDPKTGVPALRIFLDHGGATISGADSRVLRTITPRGDAFAADRPAMTITGTNDPVVAALLTSSELPASEALLLSCGRVL